MGNYLALCKAGDIQSREALLRKDKVLLIMRFDGKVLVFTTAVLVRDVVVNYPNTYVGLFKEATQPLPLNYRLKMGMIYYLFPSIDATYVTGTDEPRKVGGGAKRVKVVITKDQLKQLLVKQGRFEEVLLGPGVTPKLEPVPEGIEVVC